MLMSDRMELSGANKTGLDDEDSVLFELDVEVKQQLMLIEKVIRRRYAKPMHDLKVENELLRDKISQLEEEIRGMSRAENLDDSLEEDAAVDATQETILSDAMSSPIKQSTNTRILDFSNGIKRVLYDEETSSKRTHTGSVEDWVDSDDNSDDNCKRTSGSFLDSSQLIGNMPIIEPPTPDFVDLTMNTKHNRPWYPEDFIRHPMIEKYVSQDHGVNISQLPGQLQDYYSRQLKHLKDVQSGKLNDLHPTSCPIVSTQPITDANGLVRVGTRDLNGAYDDARISSMYKYEINSGNLDVYLRYYPNLLKTTKVKQWRIPDESGDASDDFMLTQAVMAKNEGRRKLARERALLMLFHALFVIDVNGKQVGGWVFRDKELNEKVKNGEGVVDLKIFSH